MAAHKLWYNNTLKEVLDKPRIYHQLVPMEIRYEYRTTKVKSVYYTIYIILGYLWNIIRSKLTMFNF